MIFTQKFFIWAFTAFVLVIVLCATAVMIGDRISKEELDRSIAALEQRGESFDIAKLAPHPWTQSTPRYHLDWLSLSP